MLPSVLKKLRINGVEYVTFANRGKTIPLRLEREKEAKIKWRIAREAAHILGFIPTIQMIGVTGGLAVNAVSPKDDIDFIIITRPEALWVTRFIVTLIFDVLGKRRRPKDKDVADKYCFNLYLTSDNLHLPQEWQDLYLAHEVLQMVPLWSRLYTYEKFITANAWTKKYLPNRYKVALKNTKRAEIANISPFDDMMAQWLLRCEHFARRIQYLYMRRRKTTEYISAQAAFFHPHDGRVWIKDALKKYTKKFHIALDKVFQPF